MRPQDVGFVGTNLVLGKHSGRHAFRDRVVQLGYNLDDETFQKVFVPSPSLADKKKDDSRLGHHSPRRIKRSQTTP
ncbi:MAG: hypothetical protein R3B91_17950 [Planctomycetaceae bacterium]